MNVRAVALATAALLSLFGAAAEAATSLRGHTRNQAATGTDANVAAPSGTATGDLAQVFVHCNTDTTIVDANGGTAFARDLIGDSSGTTGSTIAVFSRRIQGGDPTTWHFTCGANGRWTAVAFSWLSPHPSVIYDVAPTMTPTVGGNSGTTPALTTTANNAIHVAIAAVDGSSNTITPPGAGGYTTQENGGNQALAVVTKVITPAGAVGALTFTYGNGGETMLGVSLAIRDSGVVDTQPPTDPSNLSCSGPSSSQDDCTFTGSTDDLGVANYRVEMSSGSACSGFSEVQQITGTAFSVTGVAPATQRCFRVRAWDGTNFSTGYSNTQQPTTLALRTSNIHYTDLSTDEGGFGIERCEVPVGSTTCSNFAQIATVAAGVVDYSDTVSPNPRACYRVNALGAGGAADSGYTNTSCSAAASNPPISPDHLSVAGITAPLLAWRDLSTDETSFPVEERAGCGSGSYAEIATAAANATSWAVTPDPQARVLQYRVRSRNANGDSTAYTTEECWSRWKHSTLGTPPSHGQRNAPPPHGSLP